MIRVAIYLYTNVSVHAYLVTRVDQFHHQLVSPNTYLVIRLELVHQARVTKYDSKIHQTVGEFGGLTGIL
jgi:hypothetical protein